MGILDTAVAADTDSDDGQSVASRSKSRISFVYADLEVAVRLAQKLQSKNAGSACDTTQLASWMNQSHRGGTFRAVLGAAKSFGLVETQLQGQVSLTKIGRKAVNDATRPEALAIAFLEIPLHAEMYRQHEGSPLPPPAAIERQLESLGVPPKQKARARQTFIKSAQFSGFIDPSNGRFIKPAKASDAQISDQAKEVPKGKGGGGGGDGEGLDLDPLLIALLRKIPPVGDEWPRVRRARWFRTFAMNVSQIYDIGDEMVDLVIKIEEGDRDPQTD